MQQTQPPPHYTSPEHQRQIDIATETVLRMKESGISSAAIYDVLINKGIEHSIAVFAIESSKPGGSIAKSDGRNDMLIGGAWIAGGVILTVGSYAMVADTGGHYFITYGPVIYGIIRFFKGVAKM